MQSQPDTAECSEPDEVSQVFVAVDNDLIGSNGNNFVAQLTGNGNGGAAQTLGWIAVQLNLGVLSAGSHTLTIGGFNNKKTFGDEVITVRIDDVVVRTTTNVAQQGSGTHTARNLLQAR